MKGCGAHQAEGISFIWHQFNTDILGCMPCFCAVSRGIKYTMSKTHLLTVSLHHFIIPDRNYMPCFVHNTKRDLSSRASVSYWSISSVHLLSVLLCLLSGLFLSTNPSHYDRFQYYPAGFHYIMYNSSSDMSIEIYCCSTCSTHTRCH